MTRIIYLFCTAFILSWPVGCQQKSMDEHVRQPAVAGTFYPGDASELKQTVQQCLDQAETGSVSDQVVGMWVPHAGYVYSGGVAGQAYHAVSDLQFDAVIIIAPSHRVYLEGASIPDWQAYKTPLGPAEVDQALCNRIRKHSGMVQCINAVHQDEHAVEVQVPFVQTVFPGTPIVPMVVGHLNLEACRSLAGAIAKAAEGSNVLLIASSDMSHYPKYKDACRVDGDMLKAVRSFRCEQVFEKDRQWMEAGIPGLDCTLCGRAALAVVMAASRLMGADAVQLMPYANSGDVSGDHSRVVGYGAALFVHSKSGSPKGETGVELEELDFSQDEMKRLFQISRESISNALKHRDYSVPAENSENLKQKRGVFVTLTNHGRLRGCVGRFDASLPLYEMVSQMSEAAAIHDTRFAFNPVTLQELDALDIKISILSPLKKIESIDEIEIGKHGIWVKQGGRHGTYLPEVATELGWNREEFLSHCCAEKAGLSPDAWKTGAEIYIYASQILDEKELE